ncbi:hypothetical protein JOF53_004224 [Crossiella equi]|uniref:Lipoprotein n=1 Tax=Crossiella equi TaxID=130796 RepID=A0ABS5AGF5_9PSEU|nr:hypothetical protein [Crossiella equi]MBP2475352.1 hypothetical protein [Crossiella equi]
MLVRVCAVAALLLFSLGACSVRFHTSSGTVSASSPLPAQTAWLGKACGLRLAALEEGRRLRAGIDPNAVPEEQRAQAARFFRAQGKVNEDLGKALGGLTGPEPPGARAYRDLVVARVRDIAEDSTAAAAYLDGTVARTAEELAAAKEEANRLATRREAEHGRRSRELALPPEFTRAYEAVPECGRLSR